MKNNNNFIYDDLHIARFNNGVKLLSPKVVMPGVHSSIAHLKQLPFSFYILNHDNCTQSINAEGAAICGFQSIDDSLGKSLLEVSQESSAMKLMNNCHEVMDSHTIKIYEEENIRKDNIRLQFLSIKAPLYSGDNQIIGTLGFSIVLGKHGLAESLAEIKKLGLLDAHKADQLSATSLDVSKLQANHIHLSKRELDCLQLTIKGYTAKMIARVLQISHRTIEEYLNHVRIKMGVTTKSEMIALTLDNFFC